VGSRGEIRDTCDHPYCGSVWLAEQLLDSRTKGVVGVCEPAGDVSTVVIRDDAMKALVGVAV
jgi:hypothetical protein